MEQTDLKIRKYHIDGAKPGDTLQWAAEFILPPGTRLHIEEPSEVLPGFKEMKETIISDPESKGDTCSVFVPTEELADEKIRHMEQLWGEYIRK